MSDRQGKSQKAIRLGTHGEDYGSWMSNPVFGGRAGGSGSIVGYTVICSVPYFYTGHPVCDYHSRAAGSSYLDHMDSAAVCL